MDEAQTLCNRVAALEYEVEQLTHALRKVQWTGPLHLNMWGKFGHKCAAGCGGWEHAEHKDGCIIASALPEDA